MVTSPYEWKILEWDDKLQTNKQTIYKYEPLWQEILYLLSATYFVQYTVYIHVYVTIFTSQV